MPAFAIRHLLLIVFGLLVVCTDVILDAFDNQITSCCTVDEADDDDGDDEHNHHKHPAHVIKKRNGTCKMQQACQAVKKHVHDFYLVAQQLWKPAIVMAFTLMIAFPIEDHRMVNFDVINLIYEPPKLTNR